MQPIDTDPSVIEPEMDTADEDDGDDEAEAEGFYLIKFCLHIFLISNKEALSVIFRCTSRTRT